jgi:periplasmic divalent cation tolerance protein
MDEAVGDLRIAYITCGDLAEAEKIGRALVSDRLAACVNVLPGLRSIFWWQGHLEEHPEIIVIAKTCVAHMDAVIARVKSLHRYATPCVVFLPVVGGNPPFLSWLRAEMVPKGNPGTATAVRKAPPAATTDAPPPG